MLLLSSSTPRSWVTLLKEAAVVPAVVAMRSRRWEPRRAFSATTEVLRRATLRARSPIDLGCLTTLPGIGHLGDVAPPLFRRHARPILGGGRPRRRLLVAWEVLLLRVLLGVLRVAVRRTLRHLRSLWVTLVCLGRGLLLRVPSQFLGPPTTGVSHDSSPPLLLTLKGEPHPRGRPNRSRPIRYAALRGHPPEAK